MHRGEPPKEPRCNPPPADLYCHGESRPDTPALCRGPGASEESPSSSSSPVLPSATSGWISRETPTQLPSGDTAEPGSSQTTPCPARWLMANRPLTKYAPLSCKALLQVHHKGSGSQSSLMMEASGPAGASREHDTRQLHAWRRGSWARPSNGARGYKQDGPSSWRHRRLPLLVILNAENANGSSHVRGRPGRRPIHQYAYGSPRPATVASSASWCSTTARATC
jgi:hypothetical protein